MSGVGAGKKTQQKCPEEGPMCPDIKKAMCLRMLAGLNENTMIYFFFIFIKDQRAELMS